MVKSKKYKGTSNNLQNMHINLKIKEYEPHYAIIYNNYWLLLV
jgi:hypothetical protein